ncbi:hypothetical protein, partial [Photobacterium phosphoreum]|uniref:hypothetical protein n=1 Tax=Photobacterium phosphoreum TaxID=659 RepID=UPI0015E63F2D
VAVESKPDENTTTGGLFDDMTFNDLKADAPKVDVAVESKPDETTIADGLFDDIAFNDLKIDASKVDVAVESKPDETTIADGLFDDIAFNDLKTDASKVDVAMESKPDEITIAGGLFDNIAIESTDTSTVPINDIKISTNIADHKVEHAPDLSKSNFDLGAVLQVAKTSNYNDVNKSQDLDAMFLAIANKNNHEAKERTDFIKQAKMLITWLDDGIATGAIRYNKISNTKNYCYNCRAGWFICIWSAINAYNESNPNSTINIQRTEKIITELMNLRLIHLSNVNKSTREAVISIQDKQNINLKGVFVKRESLPKISNNNSFVDASKFTVIP